MRCTKKWSLSPVAKNLPATFTNMIGARDSLEHEFAGLTSRDAVESRGAMLEMEWSGTFRFHRPATWTHEEARAELAAMLATMARARCMAIIVGLPDDVVSVVAPQLEEICEYETRMAHVRKEVAGPDIKERWISLPAGR
jgi:hypothetical protein